MALRALRWKSMKMRRLRFAGAHGGGEGVGGGGGDALRERAGRRVHRLPGRRRVIGTTTWTPLPPVVLAKGTRPSRCELVADVDRRLDHLAPGDALAGVEVEDDPVGLLDQVAAAAPGMQLDDAELGEGEVALGVLDGDVGAVLAVGLLDLEASDALRACR